MTVITCETGVGRAGGEKHVGKKLFGRISLVLWPIFDVIPDCRLQSAHEGCRWCTQLLDDLRPLIDVIAARK